MKLLKLFLFLQCVAFFIPTNIIASEAPQNMVLVKGGCFSMGTDEVYHYELGWENISERPAHKVCVSDFFMDKYEITQAEWQEVMGKHVSNYSGKNLAVDRITWKDAAKYCLRVGKRLPWEAEWEFAAKAGTTGQNPWEEGQSNDFAWTAKNSARKPHPVGTKKPNALGLHDMMGGVWEWVLDWYSLHYYAKSPEKDPHGPSRPQSWRVIRGLSWVDELEDFRSTIRLNGMSDRTQHFFVGARCVKPVKK